MIRCMDHLLLRMSKKSESSLWRIEGCGENMACKIREVMAKLDVELFFTKSCDTTARGAW